MTGTLSGSALIYGTTGTLWIIVSQQVRIHDALDADFYLKVGSKPIIETCRNLGFAPYLGGEPSERNLWAEVEDFNWLRQQPSPNWTVITEPERISDVDGLFARAKEGANAVDLLKASLRRQ